MGLANSFHASAYYSEYNKRFDLTKKFSFALQCSSKNCFKKNKGTKSRGMGAHINVRVRAWVRARIAFLFFFVCVPAYK